MNRDLASVSLFFMAVDWQLPIRIKEALAAKEGIAYVIPFVEYDICIRLKDIRFRKNFQVIAKS